MTKLRVWDRVLAAVMGVVCIALAVAMLLYAVGLLPVQPIEDAFAAASDGGLVFWIAFGAVVLALVLVGAYGIGMLFRRRRDKGFVVQHTEFGDMSISMKAMENMVKKCVDAHSELTVNQTKIYLVRNGVSVDMKVTLAAGVNIPLTINALQKQIKQYITSCSGVDVDEVRVRVETDAVRMLPSPNAPVIEPPAAEEAAHVETPAEAIYQHVEEPGHYVAQPAAEQPDEPAVTPPVQEADETAEQPPQANDAPAFETPAHTPEEETDEAQEENAHA